MPFLGRVASFHPLEVAEVLKDIASESIRGSCGIVDETEILQEAGGVAELGKPWRTQDLLVLTC
jgi:hypothetical protein